MPPARGDPGNGQYEALVPPDGERPAGPCRRSPRGVYEDVDPAPADAQAADGGGPQPDGLSREDKAVVEEWLFAAEDGELDIYTCLGLHLASRGRETRKMLGSILTVTLLQLMIPCLMLQMEIEMGISGVPRRGDLSFRAMGCILYLYSIWKMYDGASDECRSLFLNFALKHKAPMGYWLPPLLGEISNSFVSTFLVLMLYLIYCNVEKPEDLILNAVAVNFVGVIDTEFTNSDMKRQGIENFRNFVPEYCSKEASSNWFTQGAHCVLTTLRVGGTLCMGHLFAVLFLCYGQPEFCEHLLGGTSLCIDEG